MAFQKWEQKGLMVSQRLAQAQHLRFEKELVVDRIGSWPRKRKRWAAMQMKQILHTSVFSPVELTGATNTCL